MPNSKAVMPSKMPPMASRVVLTGPISVAKAVENSARVVGSAANDIPGISAAVVTTAMPPRRRRAAIFSFIGVTSMWEEWFSKVKKRLDAAGSSPAGQNDSKSDAKRLSHNRRIKLRNVEWGWCRDLHPGTRTRRRPARQRDIAITGQNADGQRAAAMASATPHR